MLRSIFVRGASSVCGFAVMLVGTVAHAQQLAPAPDIALKLSGEILAVARQADGGAILAGRFTSIDGVARGNLARITPSGALDREWNPTADGTVHEVAIDAEGDVYVAGTFGTIGGIERTGLAKLSGDADGAVIAEWDSGLAGYNVYAMETDPQGSVYLGGGALDDASRHLMKVSGDDGRPDAGWNGAPDPGSLVLALQVDESGVYIGGLFTADGGLGRKALAKVALTNGRLLATWNPPAANIISDLALDAAGAIYATGYFGESSGSKPLKLDTASGVHEAGWNAQPADAQFESVAVGTNSVYAIAWDVDGSGSYRDVVKMSATNGTRDAAWSPRFEAPEQIHAIETVGGEVLIGGQFDRSGNQRRLSLARIAENGTLGTGVDIELPGTVAQIVTHSDGGMIVRGHFLKADGHIKRNLLRIRPDGAIDANWSVQTAGTVSAMALSGDWLYLGGDFQTLNDKPLDSLARLDATTGAVDEAWNPAPDGAVLALAADASARLYAGGVFGEVMGEARAQSARFDAEGRLDPSWTTESLAPVTLIAVDEGRAIYMGGDFWLSRFGLDGERDESWDPLPLGPINAVAIDPAGSLYIGGEFEQVDEVPRNGLAKLTGEGNVDPLWNPAGNDLASISALTFADANSLYVGGSFLRMGGADRRGLAKVSIVGTGANDAGWNPRLDGNVAALAHGPEGALAVGGSFSHVGERPRDALAVFADPVLSNRLFRDGFED